MTDERAIEILDPEHREHYESIEPVEEACRIGIKAIKRVKELEAENSELRKRLYDIEDRMERHMLALKSVCKKYVVAANINTITDENGKSWIADKEICAIDLMANELKKIDDNIGRYKK